ncbi:MAG: hypothetical protein M0R67_03510 [Candidatus Cloacimonas sp.]|nr:hypothetical protein [Candidatus Cloacimonas sp.]
MPSIKYSFSSILNFPFFYKFIKIRAGIFWQAKFEKSKRTGLRDCEWKIYESEQFFVFFNKENREKKRKLTKRKREKKRNLTKREREKKRNLTKREREKKRKLTKRKREKELFCDFCKKEEKSSRHSHPTKK